MTGDDLVVRARRDRSAFGALYDRYYPRIMRYCLRRLFVRDVAEDVVADVFLRADSYLPGFEGTTEIDFRRWLFRIASNGVNAHLRQTRGATRTVPSGRTQAVLWDRPARMRRDSRIRRAFWPAVYQAILELEPRDQTILTLRFFAARRSLARM